MKDCISCGQAASGSTISPSSRRLQGSKWKASFDSSGRVPRLLKLLPCIVESGIDEAIRPDVWEYLLGCYSPSSTADERQQIRAARHLRFAELLEQCRQMHSSVGTGKLAYTAGNKFMDLRVVDKNEASSGARLGLERVSSLVKLRLEALAEDANKAQGKVMRLRSSSFAEMEEILEDLEVDAWPEEGDATAPALPRNDSRRIRVGEQEVVVDEAHLARAHEQLVRVETLEKDWQEMREEQEAEGATAGSGAAGTQGGSRWGMRNYFLPRGWLGSGSRSDASGEAAVGPSSASGIVSAGSAPGGVGGSSSGNAAVPDRVQSAKAQLPIAASSEGHPRRSSFGGGSSGSGGSSKIRTTTDTAAPPGYEGQNVRQPDTSCTQTSTSSGQAGSASNQGAGTSGEGPSGGHSTSAARRSTDGGDPGQGSGTSGWSSHEAEGGLTGREGGGASTLVQIFRVISSKSDELGLDPGEELREEGGRAVQAGPNLPRRINRSTSDPTGGGKDRREATTGVKHHVKDTLLQGRGPKSREEALNDPVVKLGLEVTEEKVAEWLWTLRKIVVDVVRTDQNLAFFQKESNMARVCDILAVHAWIDPLTGYCQGMCDLVSPFVVLFEDNADAFWCFEFLISRVRHNFLLEGPVGVMKQLEALRTIVAMTDLPLLQRLQDVGVDTFMFAFRMLLVLFRRELPFQDVIHMWEMMWAADFNPLAADTLLDNAPNALQLKLASPLPSIPYSSSAPSTASFREDASPSAASFMKGMWRRSSRGGDPVPLKQWGQAGSGDEEISVFAVAAIMRHNRRKLMKELEAAEDALKMFNDVEFTIEVRTCVQTAVKLRKDYLKKLTRLARMAPPS